MGCGAHLVPRRTPSTMSASPRTATTRRGWHGCTAARWASAATARSGSACTWSPTAPPRPSTGVCSFPRAWDDTKHGDDAMLAEAIRAPPRQGRHPRRRLATGRSGAWPWTCSTRSARTGSCRTCRCVADAGYGDATGFREGLTERGLTYAVAVKATTTAHPGDAHARTPAVLRAAAALPRPPTASRTPPCAHLALAAGRDGGADGHLAPGQQDHQAQPDRRDALHGSWPCGSAPPTATSPAPPTAPCPNCWLLVEWPPDAAEPTDYWLSDTARRHPTARAGPAAKIRWRSRTRLPRTQGPASAWTTSKAATSPAGTATSPSPSLAQAFCTMLRLDPKAPAPAFSALLAALSSADRPRARSACGWRKRA